MSLIAFKRIKREFLEMPENDGESDKLFHIKPVNDNLLNLKGYIVGPVDTPFEGGTFNVEIKIPESYPFNPPKVRFTTRIWHPNISSVTGAICLDILKDQWAAAMTLRTVLLSIQSLLASPEPDDPQDAVVARQFKVSLESYRQTARFWTYYYASERSPDKRKQFEAYDAKIKMLQEINQIDEESAICALSQTNWDIEQAINNL
ncbi:hypothetical protein SSS_02456 [Sarcoptes scabiei]|uniref:Ubiquitin-conjugating enzyme E2 K n=1 Tax=Sarcoptes scabiei TaxID=52283 RepID=A0A834R5C9_SARSC|nr:hypothetical protein SSS_02456 [Sarcoptes scabiei]